MTRWATLTLLGMLGVGGCSSPSFDTTVDGSTTISGSPLGALLGSFPAIGGFSDFNISQSQAFQNQGVTSSEVSSVKLTALTLQITMPDNQDFSFLQSLQFFATAPGQPQVQVAHLNNISSLGLMAPNPTLVMDVDGPELKADVTASSMSLTTHATGSDPGQDTTISAIATFHVVANLP